MISRLCLLVEVSPRHEAHRLAAPQWRGHLPVDLDRDASGVGFCRVGVNGHVQLGVGQCLAARVRQSELRILAGGEFLPGRVMTCSRMLPASRGRGDGSPPCGTGGWPPTSSLTPPVMATDVITTVTIISVIDRPRRRASFVECERRSCLGQFG